jgi:hypothetical protein
MRIPSYDDLTPPIEDVAPGEVFDVARLISLRRPAPVCPPPASGAHRRSLFACLHTPRAPGVH